MAEIVDTPAQAAELELAPLIVREPLEAYLDAQGLGSGRLEAERIGDGHSNITYLVRRGDARFVLRRPPRPPLPPSAHDVLREARLLSALEPTAARTPRVLAACDDESILGVPFYVMEEVEGDVITTAIPPALDDPAERARIGDELVDALVEVHAVDWQAAGPRGLRQAHRLPRPPAAALQRAVGAQQDARAADRAGGGRLAGAQQARVPARHDRARRLPPRQHDGRLGRARAGDRDLRLGAGHDRRPAGRRRLPHRHLGAGRRPGGHVVQLPLRRHTEARLPNPRAAHRALRGGLGPLGRRSSTGTRRWRCGRRPCSWRATSSASSRAPRDDEYLGLFQEGVPMLAEKAREIAHGG